MASALKKILLKLKQLNASYNFFLHYSPNGKNLHFRIEITPRIANYRIKNLKKENIILLSRIFFFVCINEWLRRKPQNEKRLSLFTDKV